MKAGFLQFAPRRADLEGNLRRLLELLSGATDALVVAPELALSGYLFRDEKELRSLALRPDDRRLQPLYHLLASRNLHLVVGFPEAAGDGVYNSALLAGPRGLLAVYRKLHLFDREKLYFRPGGAPPPVVEAAGARLGLMICYDWFFPETARWLCRHGAQIICHPANLVLPWCLDAMRTRSLENRLFSITANRTGSETLASLRLDFYGRSQLLDPDGERLLAAGAAEETLLLAELDPSRADRKALTGRNPGPDEARLDVLAPD